MLTILILTTPILTISLTIPFDSPIMKKKKILFLFKIFLTYTHYTILHTLMIDILQSSHYLFFKFNQFFFFLFFFSGLLGFPTASATTVF